METAANKTSLQIEHARSWAKQSIRGHVIGNVQTMPDGEPLNVIDPGSGATIAQISAGSAGDVDRAVTAAQNAFPSWRAATPAGRARTLFAMAEAVEAHAVELAMLESLNVGKPVMVAQGEIGMISDILRFHGGAARALLAPAPEEYVSGYFSMLRREPVGVVGAITPWNYPLLTAIFKIAGALAMGNTMVLKPSELTPLTTLRFMEIVADILPPGVLNIVLGTGEVVGSAISLHPGISLVSLTGSVASGERVVANSARTLNPTHLELGGKAPVVVFDDADLDAVVAAVRVGGYWNSGQECGAATRILCSRTLASRLTEKLAAEVATIRTGVVTDGDDVEMGPLISSRHRDQVAGMVARAKADGAVIAAGGAEIDRDGFFFEPTLITGAESGSEITHQEIFGPVVTIESFTGEADAIAAANACSYGLSASVWTKDLGRALRTSSQLDFGTVWVNAHLVLAAEMPWSGYKSSGHGRELSILGLEDFSRTKHVMIATGADT